MYVICMHCIILYMYYKNAVMSVTSGSFVIK